MVVTKRGEAGKPGEPGEPGVGGGGAGGAGGRGGRGGDSIRIAGWRKLLGQLSFGLLVIVVPVILALNLVERRAARISCEQRLVIIENQRLVLNAILYISVTRVPLLPELPSEEEIKRRMENLRRVEAKGC